jgi:hypothetical protein
MDGIYQGVEFGLCILLHEKQASIARRNEMHI